MSRAEPEIVTFVSGKGGVGKTMLAVAFARELSHADKTLILDLDFFNRGLTGLLRHGKKIMAVQKPRFLEIEEEIPDSTEWELLEMSHNVLHVAYPDLSDAEIRHLETITVDELSSSLRDYLRYLAEVSGVTLIVLDCHGGPDHLSFAACAVANISILVSEPDKITFYGTMHFVRQLETTTSPESTRCLYLVFNKVVPAFSARYLTRFYNTTVRSIFGDKPLLSIIPLEVYLTKEFEKTPFLTDVYPYSALAKKMRLMAYDLFHKSRPDLLPKSFRRMNWLDQMLTRLSLAKIPAILNLNFIMAVIAITAMLSYFVVVVAQRYYADTLVSLHAQVEHLDLMNRLDAKNLILPPGCSDKVGSDAKIRCFEESCDQVRVAGCPGHYAEEPKVVVGEIDEISSDGRDLNSPDPDVRNLTGQLRDTGRGLKEIRVLAFLEDSGGILFAVIAAWFANALLLNWSAYMDRRITYEVRLGRYFRMVMFILVLLGIWGVYSFYYGLFLTGMPDINDLRLAFHRAVVDIVAGVVLLPLLFVISNQGYKAAMEILRERRYFEGALRLAFVFVIIMQPILLFKFHKTLIN